jgi:hypothetical protein
MWTLGCWALSLSLAGCRPYHHLRQTDTQIQEQESSKDSSLCDIPAASSMQGGEYFYFALAVFRILLVAQSE